GYSLTRVGIARWNGSTWFVLPGSQNAHVLTVFDDGSGPALYAVINWDENIRRWNGSTWPPLGSGFLCDGSGCGSPEVNALAVFDDGSGPALYAGGAFNTA